MRKILFILSVLMIASCSKELEFNPVTTVDADIAKKNVDLLVAGAYSLIGSGPGAGGQEGALYATDLLLNADLLASENYMTWRGTFSQYNEISNKFMSTTNSSVTRMWRKGYAAINQANVILANLNNAAPEDQGLYKGHALFIRGIIQFELLRFWMDPTSDLGIPLLTLPTDEFSQILSPSRATISQSYAAIISDLTMAKQLLSDDDDVYANKYTAAAFLARVYLQQGDYTNALAQSHEIIQSGNYALPASVDLAFNSNYLAESIFSIAQTNLNNAGTSNDGLTTFYACDPKTPGSASRGDVQIDSTFIKQYELTDTRRSVLIYQGTCNKASVTSRKWHDPYANIPVVRLSEMYLIRAESNQRLGSAVGDTPLNDVNAIRTKAKATLYLAVGLDEILHERELELAFEGHRIHDYKRTGKQITVLDGDGNPVVIDYTDASFVLPIPQTEINTDKNLVQNTYYK